jgi:S1-C subfamily serine protease
MLERKSVGIVILTLLIFVAARLARADDLSATDVYKKAVPSIMVLDVDNKDGSGDTGTAFMALKDGMAVTAYHVVRHAANVTARFSDGQEFDVSGVVDSDPKRDIALIRVKVFGRPLLTLSSATPDIGSSAYIIGTPLDLEFTISSGLVSQIRQQSGVNTYQFTCPSSPGNSGGPILNAKGEVIGIDSFSFPQGQYLNFAVPSTYALALDTTLPTTPWDQAKDGGPNVFVPDAPPGGSAGPDSPAGPDNPPTAAEPASPASPGNPATPANPPTPEGPDTSGGSTNPNNPATVTNPPTAVGPAASAPMAAPSTGGDSNSDLDPKLATALQAYYDTSSWLGYEGWLLWKSKNGYQNPVAPGVDEIKQYTSDLGSVTSADTMRERIRTTLIDALQHSSDALGDYVEAIRDSQSVGYWLANSNDLMSQSIAAYTSAPQLGPDDLKGIFASFAFTNAVPNLAAMLRVSSSIGLVTPTDDSILVCTVYTGSIADRIGLKVGDVLQSVEGVTVTSSDDFCNRILASPGQKVKFSVLRDGKSKGFDTVVPAQ